MKSLNKLFLLAAMLFAIAAPSYATTNISGTGPFSYSANDAYVLTGDVTCSTGAAASGCVTISGATSIYGGVDIDLHGHHITTTTNGGYGLRIDGCVANIYIHDSVGGGYISGASGGFYSIDIRDSATMSGGWIYFPGITVYGSINIQSSNKTTYHVGNGGIWIDSNYVYGGGVSLFKVWDYASVTNNWIDERFNGGDTVVGGVTVVDSNYVTIDSNTVLGGSGTLAARTGYSGGNLDDGVIFQCTTGTCYGGTVTYNALYYAADMGVEWVGSGTYSGQTITHNTLYQPSIAGMGGYGAYSVSLDNTEIAYNATTAISGLSFEHFYFTSQSNSGTKLTSINIHDNTLSNWAPSAGGSVFGFFSTDFSGGHSVTLTNNTLGSDFSTAHSVTDGGSNICYSSNDISLTCH